MAGPHDKQFTVTRTIDAPREAVWRAWTNVHALHSWLHPEGVLTPLESIKADVRDGGRYAYTLVVPNRGTFPTAGTYLEVRAPERLKFSWGNPEDSEKHYPIITVDLADLDGKTELTFEMLGVRDDRGHERSVYDGWNEALTQLAQYLADRP
jgi:uncharacterized protein YndB with AHSA1/START domain